MLKCVRKYVVLDSRHSKVPNLSFCVHNHKMEGKCGYEEALDEGGCAGATTSCKRRSSSPAAAATDASRASALDRARLDFFAEHGYVVLPALLTHEELRFLQQECALLYGNVHPVKEKAVEQVIEQVGEDVPYVRRNRSLVAAEHTGVFVMSEQESCAS